MAAILGRQRVAPSTVFYHHVALGGWRFLVSGRLEILEAEALKLTLEERAHLAGRLIASLSEDADIEEAWAAEVERHIAEIQGGRVTMIPAAEAIARVRGALE